MSGLIYEVAWVRSLELIFGTTTFAVATVLAAFMGGLACGSYGIGLLAPRIEKWHPLKVYAVLECLIAAVAILIPLLLKSFVPLYQWVYQTSGASFLVFSLLRFLLSALVLLVPTFLMGATLPVISSFVSRDSMHGRKRIGLVYAANTLGAVLGCAGAGLLLFPAIGLAGTQWVAVALNLAAAAGSFVLASRISPTPAEANSSAAAEANRVEAQEEPRPPARRETAMLVGLYMASGLVAMAYEVAWSRVLVLVLGSSTYAYTIMLATFLLGLALGAALAAQLARRFKAPLVMAGLCQIAVGVTTLLSLFLVDELPFLYLKAYEAFEPSPRGLLGVQFLLAGGLMILPTLGLGAMFPITIQGLNPTGQKAVRVVGWAYALNTVGAIAGSVLAGFVLVPFLGSQNTLVLGIGLNLLLGAAAIIATPSGLFGKWRVAGVTIAMLVLANFLINAPRWDPSVMSSGVFRYVRDYVGLDRAAFRERARKISGEVLAFDEGLTCTVAVFRTPESVTLLVNGKPDASIPSGLGNPFDTNAPPALYDLPTQILLGQLPLLLAPKAEDVLVIGLGSGLTLGSVLTHPVKSADCIELEDAVVRGSRHFEEYNRRPLEDPRTAMIVNDARNHLVVTPRKYDVIISEPSNPWIPGAANLFTREFFKISRARLNENGVFCQWLQLYELHPDDVATVLRTFLAVYPEVHLFRVDHDAILVGSVAPLPIDEAVLRSRWGDQVKQDLARIQVEGVEDLLARYWIGGEELRRCIPSSVFNTDDNMHIEFAAPLQLLNGGDRKVGVAAVAQLFQGRTTAAIRQVKLGPSTVPAEFWAGVSESALRNKAPETLIYSEHSLALTNNPQAAAVRSEALLASGRTEEARRLIAKAAESFPDYPAVLRTRSRLALIDQKWPEAVAISRQWLQQQPGNEAAGYTLGRALLPLNQNAEALAALEKVAPDRGRSEEFQDLPFYLGAAQARAGHYAAAITSLNNYLRRSPLHVEARALLAEALQRSGRQPEAAVQWQKIAILNVRASEKLRQEGLQLWSEGQASQGIARLQQALKLDPGNPDLVLQLARVTSLNGDHAAATKVLENYLAWHPDRAPAVGYLSQLLSEQRRQEEASLMAARYRALTGSAWETLR